MRARAAASAAPAPEHTPSEARRATPSIEPARIAGDGSTRVASIAGRRVARDGGGHPDDRGEDHDAPVPGASDVGGRKVDARRPCRRRPRARRARRRSRGSRRAPSRRRRRRGPRRGRPRRCTPRPAPSARSVAISGRRRSTAIETALKIRKIPTSSVSEPSAFRLKRKARTMRSDVSAALPGESSERPRGRRRAISRRAVSLAARRDEDDVHAVDEARPCRAGPAP